jgi:phosphatidylglycerophosphate synthase
MSSLRKLGTVADVAMDIVVVGFLLVSAARLSRGWLIAAIVIAVLVVLGKTLRLTRALRRRQ